MAKKLTKRAAAARKKYEGTKAGELGWSRGDYVYCHAYGATNLTRWARVTRTTKARVFVRLCEQRLKLKGKGFGASGTQTPGRCTNKEVMLSPGKGGWSSKLKCSWRRWNRTPVRYDAYLN